MSEPRNQNEAESPSLEQSTAGPRDLSEAGMQFDDELQEAQAEADDESGA